MGMFLGLLTALTWGGADFIARFSTQRMGTLRTMLYMQSTGFLLLSIALPWLGGLGHLSDGSGWQPWAWGLLAGGLNAFGSLALYRAFEVGKMAVVAPLSASYPALTLVLSWLSGQNLSAERVAGILLILFGVVIVAGSEKAPDLNSAGTVPRGTKAIALAICAATGFGLLFWLLGTRIISRVGAVPTVWMIRLTSSLVSIAVIFFFRQPARLPRGNVRAMALSMGAMDTIAFILSNRAMQMEQVAVISVLGSLYGAVTVGLAAIFLCEHVSRWQWLGIASIFSGIFLISR